MIVEGEGSSRSKAPAKFIEAAIDKSHYRVLRATIDSLIEDLAQQFDHHDVLVLDVAPESHVGSQGVFKHAKVETLDIDEKSNATHIADLCRCNCDTLAGGSFDLVICTEVLEHTRRPWLAAIELHRLVRPGGHLAVTTPFNFRIHGPAPDCWRFTDEGLKTLFSDFHRLNVTPVEDPNRARMPIQYVTKGVKSEFDESSCWHLSNSVRG